MPRRSCCLVVMPLIYHDGDSITLCNCRITQRCNDATLGGSRQARWEMDERRKSTFPIARFRSVSRRKSVQSLGPSLRNSEFTRFIHQPHHGSEAYSAFQPDRSRPKRPVETSACPIIIARARARARAVSRGGAGAEGKTGLA